MAVMVKHIPSLDQSWWSSGGMMRHNHATRRNLGVVWILFCGAIPNSERVIIFQICTLCRNIWRSIKSCPLLLAKNHAIFSWLARWLLAAGWHLCTWNRRSNTTGRILDHDANCPSNPWYSPIILVVVLLSGQERIEQISDAVLVERPAGKLHGPSQLDSTDQAVSRRSPSESGVDQRHHPNSKQVISEECVNREAEMVCQGESVSPWYVSYL